MSDFENENEKDDNMAPPPGSDYEVAFSYHSESMLERAYDKAEHWVKEGVRPKKIFFGRTPSFTQCSALS